MSEQGRVRPHVGVSAARSHLAEVRGRGLLTVLLAAALVWSVLQVDWSGDLVHSGGADLLGRMLGELARPDLSSSVLDKTLDGAVRTVAYAVAGMTLALLLAIPMGVAASGALVRRRYVRPATMVTARGVLAFARAIHELVWAWLFVAAIGLSPFAAVFALAIPYAGVLGRIYADLLNDTPQAPLSALRETGARESLVFLYGRLPIALPDLVSYSFYRFECALRSSAILSFVGLGGLGHEIQIAVDELLFRQASTHLLALIALVAVVDTWSSEVRRRMAR